MKIIPLMAFSLKKKKNYTSFQITDFLEFLHKYFKEKSETLIEFQNSLVIIKNIKIIFDMQRLWRIGTKCIAIGNLDVKGT